MPSLTIAHPAQILPRYNPAAWVRYRILSALHQPRSWTAKELAEWVYDFPMSQPANAVNNIRVIIGRLRTAGYPIHRLTGHRYELKPC